MCDDGTYRFYGNSDYDDAYDDDGQYYGPSRYRRAKSLPKRVTCRRCNRENLYWYKVDGKWRLFEGDKMHVCLVAPLQEHNNFETQYNEELRLNPPRCMMCPFCGNEAKCREQYVEPDVGWQWPVYAVECSICHAHGPKDHNKIEAILLWNKGKQWRQE